jgi:parallel beta-helix repeat protein
MLTLLLTSMLTLTFNVRPVSSDYVWSEAIYVLADGSIQPSTAPISSVDNVIYTLTDNITGNVPPNSSAIIIQRDNIIIDGAGYTLQGSGSGKGFYLYRISNVTIKNTSIQNLTYGVSLFSASLNTVSGNNITDNWYCGVDAFSSSNDNIIFGNAISKSSHGINFYRSSNNIVSGNKIENAFGWGVELDSASNNTICGNDLANYIGDGIGLFSSSFNTISGNDITNNTSNGIGLYYSSNNNTVSGNNITNNTHGILLYDSSNGNIISGNNIIASMYSGIWLDLSSDNRFYHNNFIDNRKQVNVCASGCANVWDDGYPSGGNYWSDYNGTDSDPDGIGDTAYVIDANNTDNYPLVGTFCEFTVTDGMLYNIGTVSNFTILDLYSLHELRINGSWYLVLEFIAVIPKGTVGFCRIDIPRVLMDGPYQVFTIGGNFTPTELPISNSSHALLYFTLDHTGPVIIVPEFPPFLILPLFIMATLMAVLVFRKKHAHNFMQT